MIVHQLRLRVIPVLDDVQQIADEYVDVQLPPLDPDRTLLAHNQDLEARVAELRTELALLRRRHRPWYRRLVGR